MSNSSLKLLMLFLSLVGLFVTAISIYIPSKNVTELFNYFAILMYSPYLGLSCLAVLVNSKNLLKIFTCFQIILLIFSLYLHVMNLRSHDDRSTFMYLIFPFFQWAALIIVSLVTLSIHFFSKRTQKKAF